MATVDRVWRLPAAAASRALDADIEASLAGHKTHPDGTVFIPKELATPDVVESYRREGSHVAIVSAGSRIELLRPRMKPDERLLLLCLAIAAAVLWAARARV
jgi:hypothetical protein